MTGFKFEDFTGLSPRTSPRLLAPNAATIAKNTNMLSGELRGFHAPREAKDLTSLGFTVKRAYRIPAATPDPELWLGFASPNVDIVRSLIINDTYDRYYVAGDGVPKYNTKARIAAAQPFFTLGVPVPVPVPTLVPFGIGTVTVAYLYTYVTAYGEEGPPSTPVISTGDAVGPATPWTVGNLPTTSPDPVNRNLTKIRIYRTIPGESSSLFFRVDEVSFGSATYIDNDLDTTVVLNPTLESTSWMPPATDMEGFIAMPNGFLVGWAGRRLMFSEPYRPHAWPVEYELATEYKIVGLGVWNDTLVIGTESQPYVGQGISPSSFTMRKSDVVEPCLSRRGVVSSSIGVYYPSPNGLILVGGGGPELVTRDIVTKDEWLTRYTPEGIIATQEGVQYVAFASSVLGFIFTPAEQGQKFVEIDRFQNVVGIETDKYLGSTYLIYQNRVWDWNPVTSERLYWTWRSKEFHLPKPVNFGAIKLKFDVGEFDISDDTDAYYAPYNNARFAVANPLGALNTLNGGVVQDLGGGVYSKGHTLNGIQGAGQVPGWTEPENRTPLGGSGLIPLSSALTQTLGVVLRVFAGNELVLETTVLDEDLVRPPVGFKRDVWQIELTSNSDVYSLQLAETARELEKI